MRVEMDDGNFPVYRVDGAEQWKHDGVVATECDNPRVVFPVEREGYKGFSRDGIITQRRKGFTLKKRFVATRTVQSEVSSKKGGGD